MKYSNEYIDRVRNAMDCTKVSNIEVVSSFMADKYSFVDVDDCIIAFRNVDDDILAVLASAICSLKEVSE